MNTIVCPVGDQPDAIFPALRELNVEHVHMLTHKDYKKEAKQLKADLDRFGVSYSESTIGDNFWEDTFVQVADFSQSHPNKDEILVHTGLGDRGMQCSATAAAFVNGLRAANGDKDSMFLLPILKFSYYTLLQERKMKMLETLSMGPKSLNDISKELKISLSLLSYHVHGNRKSEGLIDMGLVTLDEKDGHSILELSQMGRLLLRGLLPQCEVC